MRIQYILSTVVLLFPRSSCSFHDGTRTVPPGIGDGSAGL